MNGLIRTLGRISEPGGTVVTLTLDLSKSGILPPETRRFLEDVAFDNLASGARPPSVAGAFKKVARRIREHVEKALRPETNGLYLVAGKGAWESLELAVPLRNFIHVGPTPYLAPLLAAERRFPRGYLAQIDPGRATIQEIHLGAPASARVFEGTTHRETPERLRTAASRDTLSTGPGRGGSMRDREQQRVLAGVKALVREAAETVRALHEEAPAEAVFLAGPREHESEFKGHLGRDLAKRTVHLGARTAGMTAKAARELERRAAGKAEQELLEFHERRAQGCLTALGPREILERLFEGAVARVFLDESDPVPGIACTVCGTRVPGLRARCPFCREEVRGVSLTQELVVHSLRHPPLEITFVKPGSGWLRDLGGMAALLSSKGSRSRRVAAIR